MAYPGSPYSGLGLTATAGKTAASTTLVLPVPGDPGDVRFSD
jgi:hypothetical protein